MSQTNRSIVVAPQRSNLANVWLVVVRMSRCSTAADGEERPDRLNAVRSAAAAVMSAAGVMKAAAAPSHEAATTCLASETCAGHAAGLLMLQPKTANPPIHHPMHPQPMHPPMHQAVPVPVPQSPLPHQLPQAAAYPAPMQAMVHPARLGYGLPPMAVAPPPMTSITAVTPLPPPHMQMAHPCTSNPAPWEHKRPLEIIQVRPLRLPTPPIQAYP